MNPVPPRNNNETALSPVGVMRATKRPEERNASRLAVRAVFGEIVQACELVRIRTESSRSEKSYGFPRVSVG